MGKKYIINCDDNERLNGKIFTLDKVINTLYWGHVEDSPLPNNPLYWFKESELRAL